MRVKVRSHITRTQWESSSVCVLVLPRAEVIRSRLPACLSRHTWYTSVRMHSRASPKAWRAQSPSLPLSLSPPFLSICKYTRRLASIYKISSCTTLITTIHCNSCLLVVRREVSVRRSLKWKISKCEANLGEREGLKIKAQGISLCLAVAGSACLLPDFSPLQGHVNGV